MAVYRRLKKTEFVDAELSLRFWASHDNLFQFALVPLRSYENYQLAWVTEHELIAQWQTPLNYPGAMTLIKKTALGFRISSKRRASLYGTFGLRLWRKLHKRMHRRNQRFFIKNSRELAWGLLFKLGSCTRAGCETSMLLRSRQTADEEVYALIKLSRNIENPHRNRVQGLLKRCCQVSHQDALAKNILWVFCHCATQHSHRIVKGGCETLSFSTNICFPLFMFPRTASERFHIKASRSFFTTFNLGETMWDPDFELDSVPCPCSKCRNKLPDRCFSSGQVAAGLEEFEAFLPGCASITSASAASTLFPGRAHWMSKSRALFDQWPKRHRLPTTLHSMFQEFCEEQWHQHVIMLEQSPRLNWAMLQKAKSALHKDLVLYNEDHHGLCNTWDDPSVFQSLECSPDEWRQKMLEEIPAHLSRRYSWSFCKSALLPRGTVFLKRKKQFAKGRTIISYAQSLWHPLC